MIRASLLLLTILVYSTSPGGPAAAGERSGAPVTTVDFLRDMGLQVNAAGPLLMQMDAGRNRLVVANTLSSSVTVIDCATHAVANIPIEGRALQHLKSEAMTLNHRTGDVCLIGDKSVHIVSPSERTSWTLRTDVQFESVAVHEETGNIFLAGRESASLGFIRAGSKKLKRKEWLEYREDLINLNATPPPPIRKVVADNDLDRIVALDGYQPALYVFDAKTARLRKTHPLPLTAGARWHFAGYDETRHCLYVVIETANREVVEAAKIDISAEKTSVVKLPGLREGVGIAYNAAREEVYIPYDNHPTVHVVDFRAGGEVSEIKVPAFGNDASAVDQANDVLYIGSWARGEVDVIDLTSRTMTRRITDLGIIPHMFSMAFNRSNAKLYYPKGASAVNGTFGSAVTALDPEAEEAEKIHTGWSPIELIEVPSRGSFLVFNSEDRFAEVRPDGSYEMHPLPYDYPVSAAHSPEGNIYLSYGPHQSYWPTVYIWGAKNGVLTIAAEGLSFYDRRIPRQAHVMALDRNGAVYFTQNNWGTEEQFLGVLKDEVRLYEANDRLRLTDEVSREITQRILEYDQDMHRLYLVRVGEADAEPSVLQIIDVAEREVLKRINLGLTATDLVLDAACIYVSCFDSDSVFVVDKNTFHIKHIETGSQPLALCSAPDGVFAVNHGDNTLQQLTGNTEAHKIPYEGKPDNVMSWDGRIVVTSRGEDAVHISAFDPTSGEFELLHQAEYPYGDTSFDTRNVSFFVRGQFGDAVFSLSKGRVGAGGKLWITDFLSGRLFILSSR
jgi:DNA-binding beta-propeller fold protein YncE